MVIPSSTVFFARSRNMNFIDAVERIAQQLGLRVESEVTRGDPEVGQVEKKSYLRMPANLLHEVHLFHGCSGHGEIHGRVLNQQSDSQALRIALADLGNVRG